MGIVYFGAPQKIILELARISGADVFVETGTFKGDTSKWAAKHFKSVYTIEVSKVLYDRHNDDFRALQNIKPYLGDSRVVLPEILSEISDRKCVFWLDSHWCLGHTGGEGEFCPLVEELHTISSRKDDIILIDDARLFLCAPAKPQNPALFPTISDVVKALDLVQNRRYIQIVDDVIFAVPLDQALVRSALTDYTQYRAAKFWNVFKITSSIDSTFRKFLKPFVKKIR
jgi:hypothetical protein